MCVLLSLFYGCAEKGTELRQVYITYGIKSDLMPLPALAEAEIHPQKITAEFNGNEYIVTGVIEISSSSVTAIALSDFGRIFTISYTGNAINYELSPFSPFGGKFVPEYVINDIQMIYYPLDLLKQHLPAKITVSETASGEGRRRYFSRSGKIFAEISYQDGVITYTNHERSYIYRIEEL